MDPKKHFIILMQDEALLEVFGWMVAINPLGQVLSASGLSMKNLSSSDDLLPSPWVAFLQDWHDQAGEHNSMIWQHHHEKYCQWEEKP